MKTESIVNRTVMKWADGVGIISTESQRKLCEMLTIAIAVNEVGELAAQAETIRKLTEALEAIVKITDGSQPKDYPGALMVARETLAAK